MDGFFCPHCNFHYEDWWEYVGPTDEKASFRMPCESCNEEFRVDMKTTVKFTTEIN